MDEEGEMLPGAVGACSGLPEWRQRERGCHLEAAAAAWPKLECEEEGGSEGKPADAAVSSAASCPEDLLREGAPVDGRVILSVASSEHECCFPCCLPS